MTIYFVKQDDRIYRFAGFADLENYTGKTRKLLPSSLAEAVRKEFPKAELAGRFGAIVRKWVDESGEPVHPQKKGNTWTQRGAIPLAKIGSKRN